MRAFVIATVLGVSALAFAGLAVAADDFGPRFGETSGLGLQDPLSALVDESTPFSPADIEPAAGDEADTFGSEETGFGEDITTPEASNPALGSDASSELGSESGFGSY